MKASEPFHQLQQGEDLWLVSQKYGVQLKKLEKYNRVSEPQALVAGTQVWMNGRMPKNANATLTDSDAVEVSDQEFFNWGTVASDKPSKAVIVVSQTVSEANSKEVSTPGRPETEEGEHIVQQKETLYSIAKTYGVSVSDLAQWNALDLQKGIQPGQSLKVHVKVPEAPLIEERLQMTEESDKQFHEVKNTDTLYSVARQYGVTIKELMDWNGKTDFSLSVGEKLKVTSR